MSEKHECPSCHDHATVLQNYMTHEDKKRFNCPNCGAIYATEFDGPLVLQTVTVGVSNYTDKEASSDIKTEAAITVQSFQPEPQSGHPPDMSDYHAVKMVQRAEEFDKSRETAAELVAGLSFSVIPPFELIPRIAWVRLAKRAELGQKTKGKNAWNALSDNQSALLSREALAKRLGHAIDHATKLLEKLISDQDFSGDDDAAALMWAGMYAICATEAMTAVKNELKQASKPT